MMKSIESLISRLRWLTMSPKERYAYLWNRTRSHMEQEYSCTLRRY